jgi:hypothetical protein
MTTVECVVGRAWRFLFGLECNGPKVSLNVSASVARARDARETKRPLSILRRTPVYSQVHDLSRLMVLRVEDVLPDKVDDTKRWLPSAF